MIEIKKEWGQFGLWKDGVLINKFDTTEKLDEYSERENIHAEEIVATMGVFDEDSLIEATDLTMSAIFRAWETLYHGDCLRVEIKVTYEPEDK